MHSSPLYLPDYWTYEYLSSLVFGFSSTPAGRHSFSVLFSSGTDGSDSTDYRKVSGYLEDVSLNYSVKNRINTTDIHPYDAFSITYIFQQTLQGPRRKIITVFEENLLSHEDEKTFWGFFNFLFRMWFRVKWYLKRCEEFFMRAYTWCQRIR